MDSFTDVTSYGHGAFKVIIVAALLIFMQSLMLGGRFLSRKIRKAPLAGDDYVLLTATILTTGLCALALAFPRIAGIGAPNAIAQAQMRTEKKILGQSFMAWSILYGLSIALSKCAILLLYVRVFTTSDRTFTMSVYLIGFIVIGTGIANTFGAIFQCSPVAYEWNKSIQGGSCIDEVTFARYMAIPNVVTGVIMLVMPLPLSWRLNLDISAKIALTATLLHGIIGLVASCARLIILFQTDSSTFSNDTALTWTIWTINEPANYIIAASLPTLRPIFLHILPSSFFILTKRSSSKRSTGRRKVLQSPSSTAMLSPLEGPTSGNGRQHFRWTSSGEHGSGCGECWVDLETGQPSGGNKHDNSSSNNKNNSKTSSYNGSNYNDTRNTSNDDEKENNKQHSLAAMHAPGFNNNRTDEVVPETMIHVSDSAAKKGFF